MEIITGSSDHTTKFEPPPVELDLKDIQPTSPTDLLEAALNSSPTPYTAAAVATVDHQRHLYIH